MTQSLPFPLITIDDHDVIRQAMLDLELWDADEKIVNVERAGEGNMNSVVRVATDRRSLILKQSRPWVEKYPQIAAPVDRIFAEIDFYTRVSDKPSVSDSMPRMLGWSAELYLMAMEDLGRASDYSDLYQSRQTEALPLDAALAWLAELHAIPVEAGQRELVGNRALRSLNHAHIFEIPLQSPSAIELDAICEGLEQLADEIRADQQIARVASDLGQRYLGTGDHLLHGDFYPGSWLRADGEFRVIDPEFCFSGPIEFDLGVLAAHLVLIGGDGEATVKVGGLYQQLGGTQPDSELLRGFAALEIIRRLIGVAQLPLDASLDQRAEMIGIARAWIG